MSLLNPAPILYTRKVGAAHLHARAIHRLHVSIVFDILRCLLDVDVLMGLKVVVV